MFTDRCSNVSMCLLTDAAMFQCVYWQMQQCFNVFTDRCSNVSMCLLTDAAMFQYVYWYLQSVFPGIVPLLYSVGNKFYYYYYQSIGSLRKNFSEIWIKMHLKMSSAKCRPFCPGGDELINMSRDNPWWPALSGHGFVSRMMAVITEYEMINTRNSLTHRPLVWHIYASENWVSIGSDNGLLHIRRQAIRVVAYSALSHYLNQYRVIVNWTLRNKHLMANRGFTHVQRP